MNKLVEKVHEFDETEEVYSTMGYHHYWHREEEISSSLFERIALDFERLILPLEDAGVRLAGYDGRGLPQIDHSGIVFNGVEECGHPRNPQIYIPVPCDTASGIGSSVDAIYSSNPLFVELKRRTCNGICRCESFNLPRRVDRRWHQPDEHGRYFYCCKTAFKPYDLAARPSKQGRTSTPIMNTSCSSVHPGTHHISSPLGGMERIQQLRRAPYTRAHQKYRVTALRQDSDSDHCRSDRSKSRYS